MIFWKILWATVLVAGLAVFAGLAIIVSIRGFFDIRALFKSIEEQHARGRDETETEEGNS